MANHVIVVGGGLCGLTAALILARAGKSVTVFEKSRTVGGRAMTQQHAGFRFNLGPHALFRGGATARILGKLGIPIDGSVPPNSGLVLYRGEHYRLPGNPFSLLTSSLLSVRGKWEAGWFLLMLRRLEAQRFGDVSVREWIDGRFDDPRVRQLIEALVRLTTYSNAPEEQSAAVAIRQLQLALGRGVIYVHDGWQKLVDSLFSAAVSAGVTFVTSSHVTGVLHDGEVRAIELGELEEETDTDASSACLEEAPKSAAGTRLRADVVLLAVDPFTAASLVDEQSHWMRAVPVRAACLDVGLSSLTRPRNTFALGLDHPTYFSVHSAWAHLAPKGGALIHVAKYLAHEEPAMQTEAELEELLEELQPGWRERVVHRRLLPCMVVSNALVQASEGGWSGRPDVTVPGVGNLYIAGDWVGPEGILSDASLASAKRAAERILAT